MTEQHLLHALRDCYDPGTRRNIVAAGLVHAATLALDEDAPGAGIPGVPARYIAEVVVTAPSADEAATAQFVAQIQNRLAGMEAISRANIVLRPALFPILR